MVGREMGMQKEPASSHSLCLVPSPSAVLVRMMDDLEHQPSCTGHLGQGWAKL